MCFSTISSLAGFEHMIIIGDCFKEDSFVLRTERSGDLTMVWKDILNVGSEGLQ
jgi:hypothetical protein